MEKQGRGRVGGDCQRHILQHLSSSLQNYLSQTLTAFCRLIRPVTAVVLRVTFPPEGNALVVLAHKLWQETKPEHSMRQRTEAMPAASRLSTDNHKAHKTQRHVEM